MHAETLRLLQKGHYDDAIPIALQRMQLNPAEDAARLLAICYLVQGRFQAALDVVDHFQA